MPRTTAATAPSGIQRYLLIREATAPKLGQRSRGLITYQVLTNDARQDLFLRIAKNDGGGYVSDEAVSLHNLRRCINEHPAEQPMRATAFKTAFIGRSSNQPTFAAAVMLGEGLLQRDPQRPGALIDGTSWQAWAEAQMATAAGNLAEVLVGKAPKVPGAVAATDTGIATSADHATEQAGDAQHADGDAVVEDPATPTDDGEPTTAAGKPRRGRISLPKRERERH